MPFRDALQEKMFVAMTGNHEGRPFFGQGSTGIGKTYLAYRLASESEGTTIIALPSNNLIAQTFEKHLHYQDLDLEGKVKRFYPLSARVSPSKCRALGLEVQEGELVESVLERYSDRNHLMAHEIGLDSSCSAKERAVHQQMQDTNLEGAKVILTTHMAILADAWTDHEYLRLPYRQIIVDEADQIHAMAKLRFNRHLHPRDFELLGAKDPSFTAGAMDEMIATAKTLLKEKRQDRNQILSILASLNALRAHVEREQTYFNAGVEADGSWSIYFKNPSKIISRLHDEHQVHYLSGTLWTSELEDGMRRFGSLVGAKSHSPHSGEFSHPTLFTDPFDVHSQLSFGALNFVQVKPLTWAEANEFRESGYNHEKHPAHLDIELTTSVLQYCMTKARHTEHTLCLVPSKADALELGRRLPEAIVQGERENAQQTINRYIAGSAQMLVLYGGWAGVDIPNVRFNHLVIPRLPYPAKSEIENEPFHSYQSWVARKLNQGFGRGIRDKEDCCVVWLLDKRMPVAKAERWQTNNMQVTHHMALFEAIPARFREPSLNPWNYGAYNSSLCEMVDGELVLHHYRPKKIDWDRFAFLPSNKA